MDGGFATREDIIWSQRGVDVAPVRSAQEQARALAR